MVLGVALTIHKSYDTACVIAITRGFNIKSAYSQHCWLKQARNTSVYNLICGQQCWSSTLPPSSLPPCFTLLLIYSICIRMICFEKAIQQKPSLPSQHTFFPPHACYSVQDFRNKDLRALLLRLVLGFSCSCFWELFHILSGASTL